MTLYVNEKNNLALSFEKEVEMKKKSKKVLTLLLSVTILCSCENFKVNQAGDFGDNSVVSEGVINSESDSAVSEGAVNSGNKLGKKERKRAKEMERAHVESYNYWKELLNNDYDRGEIDFIVNWLKDKDYIEKLLVFKLVSSDGYDIVPIPEDRKTYDRLQSEDNLERVKDYLVKEKLRVKNYWASAKEGSLPQKRIMFCHRFYMKEIYGDYCLIYAGSELSKGEEDMDKITGNYYEKVLFYR